MNTLGIDTTLKVSKEIEKYSHLFDRILPTGSRIICSPPTKDTDEDYLVLCKVDQVSELVRALREDGWVLGGSMSENHDGNWTLLVNHTYKDDGSVDERNLFLSWRLKDFNLMMTVNSDYFSDFTRATCLAQRLNLKKKGDRIALFEALTRDSWPELKPPSKKSAFDLTIESMDSYLSNAVNPPIYMDAGQVNVSGNQTATFQVHPGTPTITTAPIPMSIAGSWFWTGNDGTT